MVKYYFLLAISILLNCASLVLLKKGALMSGDFFSNINKFYSWINLFANGYVILSVFLFAFGAITWIITLTKLDLSVAYPAVSISYIIVAIASFYLFQEAIPFQRWLGIGIIVLGVIVMFQK